MRAAVLVLVLFSGVPPALVGCAGPKALVDRVEFDDATISTQVKTAILNDAEVGGLPIDVVTVKGAVTLSGVVKTEEQRDRVVAIAQKVGGVSDVRSELKIEP
jgi:osmotically-inducible protein OsmY